MHVRLVLEDVECGAGELARFERGRRALLRRRPRRGWCSRARHRSASQRSSAEPISPRVSSVSGTWSVTASAGPSSAPRSSERPAVDTSIPNAAARAATLLPIRPGPTTSRRLPGQAAAGHERRLPPPGIAAPDEPVALDDAAQERKQERERQLRGRIGQHVRRVRHDHAARGRCLEIHVVDADRIVRDDAQLIAGALEERCVDRRARRGHEPSRAIGLLDQLERGLELTPHRCGDRNEKMHVRPAGQTAHRVLRPSTRAARSR